MNALVSKCLKSYLISFSHANSAVAILTSVGSPLGKHSAAAAASDDEREKPGSPALRIHHNCFLKLEPASDCDDWFPFAYHFRALVTEQQPLLTPWNATETWVIQCAKDMAPQPLTVACKLAAPHDV